MTDADGKVKYGTFVRRCMESKKKKQEGVSGASAMMDMDFELVPGYPVYDVDVSWGSVPKHEGQELVTSRPMACRLEQNIRSLILAYVLSFSSSGRVHPSLIVLCRFAFRHRQMESLWWGIVAVQVIKM